MIYPGVHVTVRIDRSLFNGWTGIVDRLYRPGVWWIRLDEVHHAENGLIYSALLLSEEALNLP